MASDVRIAPASTKMLWAGRIVSALVVLGLMMSAVMKFIQPVQFKEEFAKSGWNANLLVPLGIVEVICTLLYAIPRTSVLGAILLTGYLGGAVATHVRTGDSFIPPIVLGILVWLGLFLRDPRLREILPLRR